jgi:diaminopimelate epimerase
MRIFNPDGSEAEMCGNAIRVCSIRLLNRITNKNPVAV